MRLTIGIACGRAAVLLTFAVIACTGGHKSVPVAADGGGGTPGASAAVDSGEQDPGGDVGQPCTAPGDCASGVCEGEGCGDVAGTCAATERMCTRDAQLYCGCDGVEFRASGQCPGRRFAHRGPCGSP
ncbi:MAG: hypothetical protein U0168_17860 [Nannocystaceae bacterium]